MSPPRRRNASARPPPQTRAWSPPRRPRPLLRPTRVLRGWPRQPPSIGPSARRPRRLRRWPSGARPGKASPRGATPPPRRHSRRRPPSVPTSARRHTRRGWRPQTRSRPTRATARCEWSGPCPQPCPPTARRRSAPSPPRASCRQGSGSRRAPMGGCRRDGARRHSSASRRSSCARIGSRGASCRPHRAGSHRARPRTCTLSRRVRRCARTTTPRRGRAPAGARAGRSRTLTFAPSGRRRAASRAAATPSSPRASSCGVR